MKQGQASHSGRGATKVEPRSQAVNPAYPAQLGTALGNHVTEKGQAVRGAAVPMYEGRGLKAPMVGTTQHHAGSQKRYR